MHGGTLPGVGQIKNRPVLLRLVLQGLGFAEVAVNMKIVPESTQDPVAETASAEPAESHVATEAQATKKKGMPVWVVILVLAICLGAVYVAYTQLLKDKPAMKLPNKNLTED